MKNRNRKYGKSLKQLRQDQTVKVVTFKPQANGWYKCNKTGKRKRQGQILSHMMEIVHNQRTTIVRRG